MILRFVIRLVALLLALFLILPIVIILLNLTQNLKNRKTNKKVLNTWSKILCFVCGLKLSTKGIIQENPVFVVANHVSWLDIPVIQSYKQAGFVAKDEISKWPILGRVVKSGETLFIARGKHESRKKVIQEIKQRLRKGRSIAVFPEGKATNGERLGRFHRQLIHAAIEEGTPVQAIAIKYIDKKGERNNKVCFKEDENFLSNVFRILSLPTSKVELTFCESVDTKMLTAREMANKTQHQVARVLAENDYC